MESVSVVIPCFNSEGKLSVLSRKISENLQAFTHEIIFIDDGSTDSTWQEIRQLSDTSNMIKGLKLAVNKGQQNAVFAGLLYSQGDLVITMDDDFQHSPDIIPVLIHKILLGYDIVYAVNKKKYSIIRKTGSFLHDVFFYTAFRKPFSLKITSFRIMKKDLVKKITSSEKSFIYISAIALRFMPMASYITTETVTVNDSRYSMKKLLKLFLNLIINYSFPDSFYIFISRFKKNKPAKLIIINSISETAGIHTL